MSYLALLVEMTRMREYGAGGRVTFRTVVATTRMDKVQYSITGFSMNPEFQALQVNKNRDKLDAAISARCELPGK